MIITCRREEDGGKWHGHRRSPACCCSARRSPRASTTSIWKRTSPARFRRFGKTKRIISYHNFRKTPDDLRELHDRLAALDPDIVKIATMANDPHDNVRMLEMMQESEIPTVGMCMGDIGTPSRILAGKFGAPVHLRHVPSRTDARAGAAQLQADERDLPLRADRPRHGRVRRDRRPGRPQPQPARPQRGVRATRASTRSTCRSACRPTRWTSSWTTRRGWASRA